METAKFSAILVYELAPEFFRNGYITEALTVIVELAFIKITPYCLNRIETLTYPQNTASMVVLLKLSFKKAELLRQWGVSEKTHFITWDVFLCSGNTGCHPVETNLLNWIKNK